MMAGPARLRHCRRSAPRWGCRAPAPSELQGESRRLRCTRGPQRKILLGKPGDRHHKTVNEPQHQAGGLPSTFKFLPSKIGAHPGSNTVLVTREAWSTDDQRLSGFAEPARSRPVRSAA